VIDETAAMIASIVDTFIIAASIIVAHVCRLERQMVWASGISFPYGLVCDLKIVIILKLVRAAAPLLREISDSAGLSSGMYSSDHDLTIFQTAFLRIHLSTRLPASGYLEECG